MSAFNRIKITASGRISCVLLAALLFGCSEAPGPRSEAPMQDRTAPPVIRAPLPQTPAAPSTPSIALPLPEGAVYVCVTEAHGVRQQTVIEFPSPRVRELCRKNPEMSPCQYERDSCRRIGGRVYAADGAEITAQTEEEYNKKVLRVRLKSN